jgi:peptide/nickel transport system substrate-binding protein
MRRRRATATAITLLVALTACGSGGGQAPSDAAKVTEAKTGFVGTADTAQSGHRGGTLKVVASTSPPPGLDPIKTTIDGSVGLTEYAAIFDLLMRYDPVADRFLPQLAESMTADAQAVKFNIDRYGGDGSIQYYAPNLAEVDAIDLPDPLTVVFRLNTVDAQFVWLFTQGLGLIGSPAAIRAKGLDGFNLAPVGAGPFTVSEFVPDSHLTLARNPHYWGGAVPLDGVTFSWPTNDQTKLEGVDRGDLDVVHLTNPVVTDRGIGSGHRGFTWLRYLGGTVMMNQRDASMADPRVRQAVAYAIDADAINNRVYEGKGIPSKDLFPSGTLHGDVKGLPYDPAKARTLVDAARRDGWNGKIAIWCKPEAVAQDLCITVQSLLNAVGLDSTIDTAASNGAWIQGVYVKFDYQLAVGRLLVTPSGVWSQLVQQYVGEYSPVGTDDPKLDAVLDELRAAGSQDELRAAAGKLQALWNDAQPEVAFTVGASTLLWRTAVHGVVPSAQASVLLDKAWLAG